MSTFEPMSEEGLKDYANDGIGYAERCLALTALHHLARANAAEEARDLAIAERDEAYRQRDAAEEQRTDAWLERDELSDAARRVERETQIGQCARDVLVKALALGEGRGIDVLDAARMAERAIALVAEAEPAQTFDPKMTVTVSECDGKVFAEVDVGLISDPAFLALSGYQLARLALVVTRG